MVARPANWTYAHLVDEDLEFTTEQMDSFDIKAWAFALAERLAHMQVIFEYRDSVKVRGVAARRRLVSQLGRRLGELEEKLGFVVPEPMIAEVPLKKEALNTDEVDFVTAELATCESSLRYLATMYACQVEAKKWGKTDKSMANKTINQLVMLYKELVVISELPQKSASKGENKAETV